MCGIAGILNARGLSPLDQEKFEKMKSLLHHRGPDGAGTYFDKLCGLVQTRLALVDQKPHELPLSGASRFRIVFNGEIYNYKALRSELAQSYDFKTNTDTEVILAAWSRWGAAALDRLDGMFAFFIWDFIQQVGFAARDRLGVKPFFYNFENSQFAFASEPQALIKSGVVPFAIDEEAVAETLTAPYFSGSVHTPFSGIHILPPGHCLEIKNLKLNVSQYKSFSQSHSKIENEIEFVAQMEQSLRESVISNLNADSEVGIFLSGGLDSNLISAFAQGSCARKIKAWTIDFREDKNLNFADSLTVKSSDLPFSKRAAADLGLEHHIVEVDREMFRETLLETLSGNDLICAWEQEVSQRCLARAASGQVKAVLVGDAADETHFGYPFLMRDEAVKSPKNIISYFGSVELNKSFLTDPVDFFDEKYRKSSEQMGLGWKTLDEARQATAHLVSSRWLQRLLYNGDYHTMAYSLEARVPFAMNSVANLAEKLSPELALRGGIEKWHLRKIAEKYISHDLAWRPKSALTKCFSGRDIIFDELKISYADSGHLILKYVDESFLVRLLKKDPIQRTDRDTSIAFRILSALTWMRQYL